MKKSKTLFNLAEIRKQWIEIMDVEAEIPHIVVVHGTIMPNRLAVGTLFGMPLVQDPEVPEGTFIIERAPVPDESEKE